MKYVVYNELFDEGRWFYGMYDRNRANEVALFLNGQGGTANYCVCPITDIKDLNINNLPDYAIEECRNTTK